MYPCVIAITAVLGIFLIPILDKLKFGQTIRIDGPKRHLKKSGNTMGGIIFIPAIALAALLFSHNSWEVYLGITSMVGIWSN